MGNFAVVFAILTTHRFRHTVPEKQLCLHIAHFPDLHLSITPTYEASWCAVIRPGTNEVRLDVATAIPYANKLQHLHAPTGASCSQLRNMLLLSPLPIRCFFYPAFNLHCPPSTEVFAPIRRTGGKA